MRTLLLVFAVLPAVATASAQSTPAAALPAPAFDVATVQASAARGSRRVPTLRRDRFEARGQTLPSLIAFAYGVSVDRVVGGPNWLDLDRFDVAALSPAGASPAAQRQMLQTLLADRFKLVVRTETRSQEAWALVVGNGTLQIKRSEGGDISGCRVLPAPPGVATVTREINCRNVPLASLAAQLQAMSSGYVAGPITDATGLTGTWDARFAITPSSARAAAGEGSSIFEAAERMGLKLERRDTPVPVLVIDSVVRTPTPNPAGAVQALAPRGATEFELATVRPVGPGGTPGSGGASALPPAGFTIQPNGRILLRNMTVRDLVAFAWAVPGDMLVNSTGVLETERFEIVGDAPASLSRPVDVDEFRPMLRALLASRFGLVVHEEVRPVDTLVLTAKRDIKMTAGNDAERGWCRSTPERIPPNTGLSSAITCKNTTMAQLVDRLPGLAPNYINGRAVVDETALGGTFDFLLLWTGLASINGRVNALQPGDKEAALATVGSLTLFEALDRLGLRLAEGKRPATVVVIDRAEQPTPN